MSAGVSAKKEVEDCPWMGMDYLMENRVGVALGGCDG